MHAWEQIQVTIDYIEEHLGEEINLDALAKLASLSPFYYQKLFHRLVKKPVGEYVKLRRMAKATEVLLQKDQRILDVALSLGFLSHEHFTRTFKGTFAMTPEEYRKHPKMLSRMTKPELGLHYTMVDEGVPLISDGVILEINRQIRTEPYSYYGFEKSMPVTFVEDLGIASGDDPLLTLWDEFHKYKEEHRYLYEEEIGVAYPSNDPGSFLYFAGGKTNKDEAHGLKEWRMPDGEYIVCTFEAENFEALVMDVLYKAQSYLYSTWLPNHNIQTAPFCVERYEKPNPATTCMEIWLKVESKEGIEL